MKTPLIIKSLLAIVLFGISTTAFAQSPNAGKPFEEKILKGVLYAIDNDLSSVVESSIFVTLELKDRYPNENYKKLIEKLEELSMNGPTLSIRYKAGLAAIYYNYYDLFREIKITDYESPDINFKMIANKIENNFFALN